MMTCRFIAVTIVLLMLSVGCAPSANKHLLKIETTPPDALVSVHQPSVGNTTGTGAAAGPTPLEKNVDFGPENRLVLKAEKRGYKPHIMQVTPETANLSVTLERLKDENGNDKPEYAIPKINHLLLAGPDVAVIHRGFNAEIVSEAESKTARDRITDAVKTYFSNNVKMKAVGSSASDQKLLKSLKRDMKTVMEMTDPIRLKYLSEPLLLETKSSREASSKLGDKYTAEAVLYIEGKQNLETSGMKAGKIGITTAGTMASYAGSYSRAVARGDSFFVYNVYTPAFAEGVLLKAVLVDCDTGEILWVNKGIWPPISFNDPEAVDMILKDLFLGLELSSP